MVFNNMLLWGVSGVSDAVVVVIEGRNVVKEYNGSTQSIANYVIKSISNTEYTAADFIFSGSASASGKNVGTYPMNLTASQFRNINGKFKNVTFVVTDGYIRISPKNVTVKAVAKSKTYDGKTSTDPALTATVTGLLGSDTVTYTLSRVSGQNAGTYTITPSGAATQGNYLVNYSTAKFTINPASCTLTASSGTRTYNGSSQSITTFTSNPTGLIFASTVKASGSGTNVGDYDVVFSGVTINSTKDTTGNYVVTGTTKGKLTITKAAASGLGLKVTNYNSAYDGAAHTIGASVSIKTGTTLKYSVDNSSWYTTKPTRTAVGSTTVYVRAENSNYNTATATATITVSRAAASALGLSVSGYSGTYDGSSHTITASVSVTSGTTISYSTDNTNWSTTKPTRTNAGTTTVYVKAENSNYDTATATVSIAISKASLGLSASGYSGTYDGSSHTITASVSVTSGTTISYSTDNTNWSTTKPTRTNAGTTTVYVKAENTDTTNYNTATASASIVIGKRAVTVTVTGAAKTSYTYDGQSHSLTGYTASSNWTGYTEGSSGFSVGGTITVSRTNAGSSSQALAVTNNNSTNITLTTKITNGTLTINKRTVRVTVTGAASETYTYDGYEHSITGYTASSNWTGYTEGSSGFTVGGTITASGTEAGTYSQNLTVTNNNSTNITLQTSITNGVLTIEQVRTVIILNWTASAARAMVIETPSGSQTTYTNGYVTYYPTRTGTYHIYGVNCTPSNPVIQVSSLYGEYHYCEGGV